MYVYKYIYKFNIYINLIIFRGICIYKLNISFNEKGIIRELERILKIRLLKLKKNLVDDWKEIKGENCWELEEWV